MVMRITMAFRYVFCLIMVILLNLQIMAQEEAVAFDSNNKIFKLTLELAQYKIYGERGVVLSKD